MPCKMIAFVGRSGSGKTTLITRLIPELKKRNLRIGSLKHTHHSESFDQPGKDSSKHRQAGADQVMLLSGHEMAIFRGISKEHDLQHIKDTWFADYDLLIVEGFKYEPGFKIEVYRAENKKSPLFTNPAFGIDALVTDADPPFPVPRFTFDQVDKLVQWICTRLELKDN